MNASAITPREGVKLTAKQRQILDAANAGIADGRWELVPGNPYILLRWMRTVPTGEAFKGEGFGKWPEDTHTQCVFLSIVTGKPWSLILGIHRAPWVDTTDQDITMARAIDVLRDPAACL